MPSVRKSCRGFGKTPFAEGPGRLRGDVCGNRKITQGIPHEYRFALRQNASGK